METATRWRLAGRVLGGPGAFRLALALVVFVAHVTRFNVGRPAVLLFFMLSGFWVTRAFVGRGGTVGDYMLGRWLRIWPLLALTTVTWLAAMPLFGLTAFEAPWPTFAILGLASRPDAIPVVVAWSLDIELQFYLLLPFLLALAALLPTRRSVWFAVAAAFAAGIALLAHGIWTVFAFAPLFAAGMAIQRLDLRPSGRQAAVSVAAFVALGGIFAALPATRPFVTAPAADWIDIVGHSVWALTLTPFVAWNVHRPSDPLDRTLGDISYPFYLVHLPIIVALATLPVFAGGGMAMKLAALGVSLALAIAVHRCVDRPLERWRHRLRPTARAAPAR